MRSTSFGEVALGTLLVVVLVALAAPKSSPINIGHIAMGAAWIIEKMIGYVVHLISMPFRLIGLA